MSRFDQGLQGTQLCRGSTRGYIPCCVVCLKQYPSPNTVMGAKAAEFRAGKVSGPFEVFFHARTFFFSCNVVPAHDNKTLLQRCIFVHKVLRTGTVAALYALHTPAYRPYENHYRFLLKLMRRTNNTKIICSFFRYMPRARGHG